MKKAIVVLLVLALPVVMSGDGKKNKKNPPPAAGQASSSSSSSAKKESKEKTPPSLAKSTKLPPGLQKKFGGSAPSGAAYVAFDPNDTGRAWFLINGKWKLEDGFDSSVVGEVKASLALPKATPPVPLPDVDAKLQVVKFD